MEYTFWVNDFDRIKDHKSKYPKAGKIFDYPVSFWFGVRNGKKKFQNLEGRVRRLLNRAAPSTPVLVMYNMPDRDMGQYSKGGAISEQRYIDFITQFANAIGDKSPIVIYEPDALPHSTLMEKDQADARYDLMRRGLNILTENSNSIVYVDVGHSNWLNPEVAGQLIDKVSNDKVRGFSINVSNFRSTKESMAWGLEVAENTKNKYFIIDTSRNGNGPYGNDWCNPPGRGLGTPATTETEHDLCDAYLWVKIPGESDGTCNGGPNAGTFWLEYARDLVDNTSWLN